MPDENGRNDFPERSLQCNWGDASLRSCSCGRVGEQQQKLCRYLSKCESLHIRWSSRPGGSATVQPQMPLGVELSYAITNSVRNQN